MSMGRLSGRTAIITGGAGGIGSATARRLCDEGGQVVIADILLEPAAALAAEIRASGGDAIALHLDLGDPASIAKLIADTLAHYGKLEVVFNNGAATQADHLNRDGAAGEMDIDVWDTTFAVNARGTMLMIRHALPVLIKSGNGAIINTSSGAALLGDLARTAYAASKAAINPLTLYVAAQYGKQGVTCNVISPGMVPTANSRANQPEMIRMVERHHLTPELGYPEDIAAMVALLASDDGRFVTGQILRVDGGVSKAFAHVADNREQFAAHVANTWGGG
jgi:NAD(P)-dependent dehydrogenase (short-subunit alcohol dehydrogenase family)